MSNDKGPSSSSRGQSALELLWEGWEKLSWLFSGNVPSGKHSIEGPGCALGAPETPMAWLHVLGDTGTGSMPWDSPAKLLQQQGAGTDTGTLSSHTFVVGLVGPSSKLGYGNLLISKADGVLTEGPRWTAAVLLWLLAHLAPGASRFWAAQYQGSQHHARTHPLSVPVPGCLQPGAGKAPAPIWATLPGLALPWLFSRGAGGLSQGHCRGKYLVCTSALLCVCVCVFVQPGSPRIPQ